MGERGRSAGVGGPLGGGKRGWGGDGRGELGDGRGRANPPGRVQGRRVCNETSIRLGTAREQGWRGALFLGPPHGSSRTPAHTIRPPPAGPPGPGRQQPWHAAERSPRPPAQRWRDQLLGLCQWLPRPFWSPPPRPSGHNNRCHRCLIRGRMRATRCARINFIIKQSANWSGWFLVSWFGCAARTPALPVRAPGQRQLCGKPRGCLRASTSGHPQGASWVARAAHAARLPGLPGRTGTAGLPRTARATRFPRAARASNVARVAGAAEPVRVTGLCMVASAADIARAAGQWGFVCAVRNAAPRADPEPADVPGLSPWGGT